jgi:phosphoglycolate phosphatase-like HAD superfamily hydrolase
MLWDAIVLDFDGTLVDSNKIKANAFGELYQSYGEKIVDQVRAYHQQNEGVSRFVKFRYLEETLLGELYTEEKGMKLSSRYALAVVDAVVKAPLLPGVHNFLEKNSKQLPLFVASGTPEMELQQIITRRGMNHYFHGVFGAPSTKAEILNNIMTKTSIPSEKLLMVGDTPADLEGAKTAGCQFVGIFKGETSTFPESIISINHFNQL